ncbi:MerR family transcriptional regulator [Cohnella cellulosilytica]
MRNLKTKEAAERLGVSQTTVKRWASHYPASFRKDPLGHYVFSQREFGLLQSIQAEIERGRTLEQIVLPAASTPDEPASRPADEAAAERRRELQLRLCEIERSLDQKADEVVSVQVRQHRDELDELRRVVAQLAAAVETLESRATAMVETAKNEEIRLPTAQPLALPERKRKLFRTFF